MSTLKQHMQIFDKNIQKLDRFQRRHKSMAFIYAVIKKYGDDEAGYKAALFTYYAFLSLFPLLLILITLTGYISGSHPDLQASIVKGATDYLPVIGAQLADHVSGLHQTGLALAIGILIILYGARGVADALQHGIQHIWGIPRSERPGFPSSIFISLKIIIIGGLGFILAAVSVGAAGSAGHGLRFNLMAYGLNVILLFLLFTFLIKASLPSRVTIKQTRIGAICAAIGLIILQALGGYLLTRELKSLDALYSFFAISLGLLFWIYLQAQILFYSVEIASVSDQKLYPRSLSGKDLTRIDKLAKQKLDSSV